MDKKQQTTLAVNVFLNLVLFLFFFLHSPVVFAV